MKNFYQLVTFTLTILVSVLALPSVAAKEVSIAVYAEHDKYILASGPYGVSWKLIELAAQAQQIELIPQKGTWEGGINRLKAEKVDLIFPSFQTEDRNKWALFTFPLIPTGSAIYALPTSPVNNLTEIDFTNAIVGVSTDSIQEELAAEVGFKSIYSTSERPQLFTMLKEKRLEYLFFAIAGENYYCRYFSEANERNCLKQIGDPYGTKPAHAMSLNTPNSLVIMETLNAGLMAIKDSREVENLFNQYQYTQQDLINWRTSLGAKNK